MIPRNLAELFLRQTKFLIPFGTAVKEGANEHCQAAKACRSIRRLFMEKEQIGLDYAAVGTQAPLRGSCRSAARSQPPVR